MLRPMLNQGFGIHDRRTYQMARGALLALALTPFLCINTGCAKSKNEATGTSASAAALAAGPSIELSETKHDFGKASEGDQLRHVFTVRNAGSETLEIDRVSTSCGCTAAVLKDKQVAPGASTEIEVKFDTKGRSGPNRKTITIFSNDPKQKRLVAEIKADIEPLLMFEPRALRLTAQHGEKKTVEAKLIGKLAAQAKPKIKEVKGSDAVKAELVPGEGGGPALLRLAVESKELGVERGTVELETGLEKPPTLRLSFTCDIRGNITAQRRMYFDPSRENLRQRTTKVTSTREDFVLQRVQVEGPFEAKIIKPDAGTGYEVQVTLKGAVDPKATPTQGKLFLISNDPVEPKKEIALSVGMHGSKGPRSPMGRPAHSGLPSMKAGPGDRPPPPKPQPRPAGPEAPDTPE